MAIDFDKVKITRMEDAEISAGLSSWAHAHLWIMRLDTADLALKTLKKAMEVGKGKDMIQRILHRYSSLNRREIAVQVSKLTRKDIR